jgi:putative oxidoreductase
MVFSGQVFEEDVMIEKSTIHTRIGRLLSFLGSLDWLALLLARLAVGYMFMSGGWGKLHDLKGFGDWFGTLGIPFPHLNAAFVAALEFVGGWCLMLGLGTRIFAFLLSCVMVVALVTVGPQSNPKTLSDWIFMSEFVLILLFIVHMVMGPGKIAVDAMIKRKLGFTDEK